MIDVFIILQYNLISFKMRFSNFDFVGKRIFDVCVCVSVFINKSVWMVSSSFSNQ